MTTKNDMPPTAGEFAARLRTIQAEAEAQLRDDLNDEGYDYETDYSLLTFRRQAAAFARLVRGEYAKPENERFTTADGLMTFWTGRLRMISEQLLDELRLRDREEQVKANNHFKHWMDGVILRKHATWRQQKFREAANEGPAIKVVDEDGDEGKPRKTLVIDSKLWESYVNKPEA